MPKSVEKQEIMSSPLCGSRICLIQIVETDGDFRRGITSSETSFAVTWAGETLSKGTKAECNAYLKGVTDGMNIATNAIKAEV